MIFNKEMKLDDILEVAKRIMFRGCAEIRYRNDAEPDVLRHLLIMVRDGMVVLSPREIDRAIEIVGTNRWAQSSDRNFHLMHILENFDYNYFATNIAPHLYRLEVKQPART